MTRYCDTCGKTLCTCMTDKDAALELAKEFDLARIRRVAKLLELDSALPDDETLYGCIGSGMGMFATKIERDKQQLLATQEAYQRLRKAVFAFRYPANLGQRSLVDIDKELDEALANTPSLESLERKKLEDEIAVLEIVWDSLDPFEAQNMIAERKAKLEKMK